MLQVGSHQSGAEGENPTLTLLPTFPLMPRKQGMGLVRSRWTVAKDEPGMQILHGGQHLMQPGLGAWHRLFQGNLGAGTNLGCVVQGWQLQGRRSGVDIHAQLGHQELDGAILGCHSCPVQGLGTQGIHSCGTGLQLGNIMGITQSVLIPNLISTLWRHQHHQETSTRFPTSPTLRAWNVRLKPQLPKLPYPENRISFSLGHPGSDQCLWENQP